MTAPVTDQVEGGAAFLPGRHHAPVTQTRPLVTHQAGNDGPCWLCGEPAPLMAIAGPPYYLCRREDNLACLGRAEKKMAAERAQEAAEDAPAEVKPKRAAKATGTRPRPSRARRALLEDARERAGEAPAGIPGEAAVPAPVSPGDQDGTPEDAA